MSCEASPTSSTCRWSNCERAPRIRSGAIRRHRHGDDPNEQSRINGSRAAGLIDEGVFIDHRDLLSSGLVDAVVLVSPNNTHAAILDDIISSGLHFLTEKPLCTTVEDARAITQKAAGYGAVSWMGLEYRYKPPIGRLVEEVRSGAVGRVKMVAIREHRFRFLQKVGDWNRFNRNTGGTLVEKCCHFFDLMNLITGSDPVRVFASGAQDVNHLDEEYNGEVPDIMDNAFVIVDDASGARAMLGLCMFCEGSKNEQEISVVGDQAKVEAFVPENLVRCSYRDGRDVNEFAVHALHMRDSMRVRRTSSTSTSSMRSAQANPRP